MAKKEEQSTLPGITDSKVVLTPKIEPTFFRINFQYQGPNYALRMSSLVIPAQDITQARIIANGTLKDQYGDKWFNVTKIQTMNEEAPF